MEVLFSCVNEPETQGWDTLPQLSDAELRDLAKQLPELARYLIAQSMETSANVPPFTPPLYHEAPKQGGARMARGEDNPSPEPSAGAKEVCVIMPAADPPPGDLPTHASSPPAELATDAAVNSAIEPTADDVPQPAEPAAVQPTPGTSAASTPSAPLPQPIPVSAPPAAPLAPQPAPPTPLAREAAFQLAANGPDIYKPVAAALGFASLDALAAGIASCVELHTSDPAQRRAFAVRAATFLRWHTAGMVRELPIVDEPVGPNESHPRLLSPQRRLSMLLEPYLSERQMPLRALQLMRLGGRRVAGDGRQSLNFLRTFDQYVATRAQSAHTRLRAWAIRRFNLGYVNNPDIDRGAHGGYCTLWDAQQARTPLQRLELRLRQPFVDTGYARRAFVMDTLGWCWQQANKRADAFAAGLVQGIRNIGETARDLATLRAISDEPPPGRSLRERFAGWRHRVVNRGAPQTIILNSYEPSRTAAGAPAGQLTNEAAPPQQARPWLRWASGARRWLSDAWVDVQDAVYPLQPHSRRWRIRHYWYGYGHQVSSSPLLTGESAPATPHSQHGNTRSPQPEQSSDVMCRLRIRSAMRLTAAIHRGFIPLPVLDVQHNPAHSTAWTLAERIYNTSGHNGDAATAVQSLAVGLLAAGVTDFGEHSAGNLTYAAQIVLPALGTAAVARAPVTAEDNGTMLTALQTYGFLLDCAASSIGSVVWHVLEGRAPAPEAGTAAYPNPADVDRTAGALWRAIHHVMPMDTAFRATRAQLFAQGWNLTDAIAVGLHRAASRQPDFFAHLVTDAQLQEWLAVLTRIIVVQVRETRAIAAAAQPAASSIPRQASVPAVQTAAVLHSPSRNVGNAPAAATRSRIPSDDWLREDGIAVAGNWMM